jgi:hypothetical protein
MPTTHSNESFKEEIVEEFSTEDQPPPLHLEVDGGMDVNENNLIWSLSRVNEEKS